MKDGFVADVAEEFEKLPDLALGALGEASVELNLADLQGHAVDHAALDGAIKNSGAADGITCHLVRQVKHGEPLPSQGFGGLVVEDVGTVVELNSSVDVPAEQERLTEHIELEGDAEAEFDGRCAGGQDDGFGLVVAIVFQIPDERPEEVVAGADFAVAE